LLAQEARQSLRAVEPQIILRVICNPGAYQLKRFSGKKNYYRRLKKTECNINVNSWLDLWHQHVDWRGYGNINWHHRKKHLDALIALYLLLMQKLERRKDPYQLFGLITMTDSTQDAIYLHTENPNSSAFPFVAKDTIIMNVTSEPWKTFFQTFEFETIFLRNGDVIFYRDNVGLSIIDEKDYI
jgi:hypothetical protein